MLTRWLRRVRVAAGPGASGQGLVLVIVVAVVTIAAVLVLGTQIAGLLHAILSTCPLGPCH